MEMIGLGKAPAGDYRLYRAWELGAAASGVASLPGGLASGLVVGTKVATQHGWQPVEAVAAGDKVLTFDSGMQVVTHVTRGALWKDEQPCPRHLWPLSVPAGALGNAQPMVLMPGQSLIIESDVGEELYGDPFTLIPASALEGFRGIDRVEPAPATEVVVLHFTRDQVVFGSAGALFFCPSGAGPTFSDTPEEEPADYVVLVPEDAAFLIGCMNVDDDEEGRTPERNRDEAAA
jgi:hypothetical protein